MSDVGRPTLYKPEYCELLIKHMSEGLSYEAFAGVVEVSKQSLYDWEKVNPEFLDAKEKAVEKSRIFWEKLGISHILNESESTHGVGSSSKSLNASVWIFNMKNRFKWRDKQPDEVDVIVNNNLKNKTDEELEAEAKEIAQRILDKNENK